MRVKFTLTDGRTFTVENMDDTAFEKIGKAVVNRGTVMVEARSSITNGPVLVNAKYIMTVEAI